MLNQYKFKIAAYSQKEVFKISGYHKPNPYRNLPKIISKEAKYTEIKKKNSCNRGTKKERNFNKNIKQILKY